MRRAPTWGWALTAPVATDNGQPIVKTVRDEFCSGTRGGALESLQALLRGQYAGAAAGAADGARARPTTSRASCALNQWSFVDARSIKLARRRQAQAGLALRVPLRGHESQGAGPGLRRDARRRELPALRPGRARRDRRADHACAGDRLLPGRPLPAQPHLRGLQSRRAGPQGLRRHPLRTSPASAASSSTRRSASRRAPAPSTRITASRRTRFPFSTATLSDPLTGKDGLAVPRRRLRSQADRDQHLDRILAEGRLAAAHRSARPAGRGAARRTRAST